MVQPPGGNEGELEFASLACVGHSTFAAHDPARTASRLKEREEKRQACMCAPRSNDASITLDSCILHTCHLSF